MGFSLQSKLLLLLLAVALVALTSAFVLRGLLVKDFKTLNATKDQEHIYQVLSSLEGRFEQHRGWPQSVLVDELIWALQIGIEVKLFDSAGNLVLDTDQALGLLPAPTRHRILAVTDYGRGAKPRGPFKTYYLSLNNQELGWLEARQLRPLDEQQFLQAADRFLLGSVLALGLLALGLGAFFARRLSTPLKHLTIAAEGIANNDLAQRVQIDTNDEIGRLAATFNRMADSLQGNERLRRQLVSNAAHELRTPLMVIRGELEGMIDGLLPVTAEALQSLHQETSRLTAILDGVDELARAEASFLSLRRERVHLELLFEGIATRFGRLAEEKQARIAVACPDGLTAWADPDRLSQILINLLSNALKALPRHGRIELRAAQAPDHGVIIEVADTGHGIDPELLPHIFERFYKGSQGGLGLGLAITRELVAAHGGSIEAASEPGHGATFTIHLPVEHTGGRP